MGTKYHNQKTMAYGILFDSKAEAARYLELRALAKAGAINDLKTQVKFELIPKITGQRACVYIADFVYTQYGKTVIEDVKSPATRTQVYLLKKKLLKWRHGLDIVEVMT